MTKRLTALKVLIRGAGEVASGIAFRLHHGGLKVCLAEIEKPLAVTRGTTFSEAIFDSEKIVMGVKAELATASAKAVYQVWQRGNIAVVIDPEASIREQLKPDVLVDARMAKRKTDTTIADAPLVIGVGPGFYASRDVDMVVESNHSDNLGKVILVGEAEKNTGVPVAVGGLTKERVIWSPRASIFTSDKEIGDSVVAGEVVGWLEGRPLKAPLSGMLRGLLRNGVRVAKGTKLIEVDQVNDKAICNIITDKVNRIGGGVLQAIMIKFASEGGK